MSESDKRVRGIQRIQTFSRPDGKGLRVVGGRLPRHVLLSLLFEWIHQRRREAVVMPLCENKTKLLPAAFAWTLLLVVTALFFYFP